MLLCKLANPSTGDNNNNGPAMERLLVKLCITGCMVQEVQDEERPVASSKALCLIWGEEQNAASRAAMK